MGQLVDGTWQEGNIVTSKDDGSFDRKPSTFRDQICATHGLYKPEKGRYHLYVSYACPWAHRTLIMRRLKNLDDIIPVHVVHPDMLDKGWSFDKDFDGATGDPLHDFTHLYQLYLKSDPHATTKVTVPVLWDSHSGTIVNNESSEIIRILNTAFNDLTGNKDDYYPENLRSRIDEINDLVYGNINNGVYKAGFATKQSAYDQAVTDLFDALDKIEGILGNNKYLVGDQMTEADIRLLTTLLRFDAVYYTHFKCNIRRIKDYRHLSAYTEKLYNMPEIKDTVHFDHIKQHYYYSHDMINPNRIVPKGPDQPI